MCFTLQEAATAIAADPKNEMVVVGTSTGMFSVLDSMKGDHLFSYQATQTEIDCMQFSPGDIFGRTTLQNRLQIATPITRSKF